MAVINNPWDFTTEQYVASVKNGSDDPGLFTPENGWHIGSKDNETYRWRALGVDGWARGRKVEYALGDWYVGTLLGRDLLMQDPVTPDHLRSWLEDAKTSSDFIHPMRPATP